MGGVRRQRPPVQVHRPDRIPVFVTEHDPVIVLLYRHGHGRRDLVAQAVAFRGAVQGRALGRVVLRLFFQAGGGEQVAVLFLLVPAHLIEQFLHGPIVILRVLQQGLQVFEAHKRAARAGAGKVFDAPAFVIGSQQRIGPDAGNIRPRVGPGTSGAATGDQKQQPGKPLKSVHDPAV